MRDKQDLKYTQKTLIRAFFDGFTNGVIDANNLEQDERQTLIKVLLNVYDKISEHYAMVLLPILGVIHHKSLEQLQRELDAIRQQDDADVTSYFKVVCREEGTYEAMVDDYKANFEALLKGTTLKTQHCILPNETSSHLYKDQRGAKYQTSSANRSACLPLWATNKACIATVQASYGYSNAARQCRPSC